MLIALESSGWNVTTASTASESFDFLERARPLAVILNLMTESLNGLEFLQRLRGDPRWEAMPVIALASLHLSAADIAFLQESAESVLQATEMTKEDVVAQVRDILSSIER